MYSYDIIYLSTEKRDFVEKKTAVNPKLIQYILYIYI